MATVDAGYPPKPNQLWTLLGLTSSENLVKIHPGV